MRTSENCTARHPVVTPHSATTTPGASDDVIAKATTGAARPTMTPTYWNI